MLVDSPVHVVPTTGDFQVRLINEPPAAYQVLARPGRVDQQRREPLHPRAQGDVIDVDAAFSEELLEIAVGTPRIADASAPPT